jgi:3-hydroxyisobutyrate dehydrogenase
MSTQRIAFLGLGVMGAPMAGWLVAKGFESRAWNRTAAKAEAWAERHGHVVVGSIAEAVEGVDVVCVCVGDDADARAVAVAAFEAMPRGALYVDHTTTSAALARELSGLAAQRGLMFVDAPVSGGQAGAEGGRLTAMCGGTEAACAKAEPVLAAYCATIVRLGEAGSGQLAKMVNQIAIAGVVQGLAEAMRFAEVQGLDLDGVMAANNRWPSMAEGRFDFGFAVDWMRKDLRIVREAAAEAGLDLPLTTLVDGFYADVQAMGGGRWDTSSLIARMRAVPSADQE